MGKILRGIVGRPSLSRDAIPRLLLTCQYVKINFMRRKVAARKISQFIYRKIIKPNRILKWKNGPWVNVIITEDYTNDEIHKMFPWKQYIVYPFKPHGWEVHKLKENGAFYPGDERIQQEIVYRPRKVVKPRKPKNAIKTH